MTVDITYFEGAKMAKMIVYGLDAGIFDLDEDEYFEALEEYDTLHNSNLVEFFETHTIVTITTRKELIE